MSSLNYGKNVDLEGLCSTIRPQHRPLVLTSMEMQETRTRPLSLLEVPFSFPA